MGDVHHNIDMSVREINPVSKCRSGILPARSYLRAREKGSNVMFLVSIEWNMHGIEMRREQHISFRVS
jgi:hypothetical protein